MVKKAVCLLSGGIDSCVTSFLAKKAGYEVYVLSFDYGQRHKKELECEISGIDIVFGQYNEVVNLLEKKNEYEDINLQADKLFNDWEYAKGDKKSLWRMYKNKAQELDNKHNEYLREIRGGYMDRNKKYRRYEKIIRYNELSFKIKYLRSIRVI